MSADDAQDRFEPRSLNIMTYTYDCEGKNVTITYSVPFGPTATCDHDRDKRLFRLTEPDGTTTEFHDREVRFLVVSLDPESGELEPVIERGGPKVIYLCKEAGL
jgi:hypothetical protein